MTERTRLISGLLHGLFIMDLSLQSINWSADNFKKNVTSISCTLKPAIQSGDTSQGYPLTITWMSVRMSTIMKLNTDYICLGHLASNA